MTGADLFFALWMLAIMAALGFGMASDVILRGFRRQRKPRAYAPGCTCRRCRKRVPTTGQLVTLDMRRNVETNMREWINVGTWADPDQWTPGRCDHIGDTVPVHSVTGELVAHLCTECDKQLPKEWDRT